MKSYQFLSTYGNKAAPVKVAAPASSPGIFLPDSEIVKALALRVYMTVLVKKRESALAAITKAKTHGERRTDTEWMILHSAMTREVRVEPE